MSEEKNKVVISNGLYFVMVISLAIYSILRNILFAVLTSNAEAFIPIAMASLLLLIIWKKSQHITLALIGWALYFIIKYGIVFFGLILAYGHNGFKDVSIINVLENMAFFLAGIVIWIGAYQFVEIHEEVWMGSIVYSRQCTVLSRQFTVSSLQSTVGSVQYLVASLQYSVLSQQFTVGSRKQ